MATASSCRPLPLLRRPLPPKQPSPPPSIYSKLEDEGYVDAEDYKALSKSSDFSTTRLYAGTKSKVISPVRGVRFCGDVPAPISSVVKPYKSKGPDPLPARPPRKPRELPFEAFIKDSYVRPAPEFTLRDFVRRLPSRQRVGDDGEPMVSEQNYAKCTSWFAANKPSQSAIHSFEIDSGVNVPDVTPRVPARQLLIEMQFQSLDTSLSPEQELLNYPEHPSTILPVTPAVSKLTIPASRYPPLPPIDSVGAVESGRTHTVSTERWDQNDTQHLATKTIVIGQAADERTITVLHDHEEADKIPNNDGGIYISREVKTRFEDQSLENYGKDEAEMLNRRKEEHADKKNKALTFELEPAMECKDMNVILPSSQPEYFQGEELPRTSSPFVSADVHDGQMSPIEAVILNAMISGSSLLNLRAHFLTQLPSLSPLAGMLTHLNLSFNDFWVFPGEILDLINLVSLKLRNNPIKEIPRGIKLLKRLRVFGIAFNLLTSLPTSLFELEHLEILDLAYNRLSFIPSEIRKLSSLRELTLEGNQLGAMPLGALHLKLKHLRVNNNFLHPLLWKETANNQPQRLADMSALAVVKTGIDYNSLALPKPIRDFLESPTQCDCCGGPMYGQGLRVIKAPSETFGVKQLPFLFTACTQTCRKQFAKRPSSMQEWLRRNITSSSIDEGGQRLIF